MSNWVSKLGGSGAQAVHACMPATPPMHTHSHVAPAVHTPWLLCPCMPPHACTHACGSAYGHALHTPTLPQQAHLHAHPPIHPCAPLACPSVPPCMQICPAHEASFALGFLFFFFLLYFSDQYGEKEFIPYSGEAPKFWLFLIFF